MIVVGDLEEIDNMDKFNCLNKGDYISFRIEKIWVDQFDSISFVGVVELKFEDQEILSLDTVRSNRENGIKRIQITAICFEIIFSLCIIYCVLLLKGINLFKILIDKVKRNSKVQ